MLATYICASQVEKWYEPDQVALLHASTPTSDKIESYDIVIIDGIDEVPTEQQLARKEFIDSHEGIQFYCLGRNFHRSTWWMLNPYMLEPDDDELPTMISEYAKQFEWVQRESYLSFMKQIIPKLWSRDLSYMVVDVLGLISQSRASISLLHQKTISRSDIYKYYVRAVRERSLPSTRRMILQFLKMIWLVRRMMRWGRDSSSIWLVRIG